MLKEFEFETIKFQAGMKKVTRTSQARYFVEDLGLGVKLEMVEIPGGTFLMGAAENEGQLIAVEIKTFRSVSDMTDLEHTLGQYLSYRSVMTRTNPERVLYLAVRDQVYADVFDEPIAKLLVEDYKVNIVVFNLEQEVIFRWIPWSNTGS